MKKALLAAVVIVLGGVGLAIIITTLGDLTPRTYCPDSVFTKLNTSQLIDLCIEKDPDCGTKACDALSKHFEIAAGCCSIYIR
jgi:hypothetical protein